MSHESKEELKARIRERVMAGKTSPFLSVDEYSAVSGFKRQTIYNRRTCGRGIPAVKFGSNIRFFVDDVVDEIVQNYGGGDSAL